MVLVLDQATVFKEFTATIPVDVYGPLRSHGCGGHAELHRYTAAAEKPGTALGAYNPLANQSYSWPGQSAGSAVDLGYVQVWLDNAYLQYYQDAAGGGDTVTMVAGTANRVRFAATNLAANGTPYPRALALGDRDVQAGDWVFLQGGGDTLWTSVRQVVADSVAGTVGSAAADPGNFPSQGASTSSSQTGGSGNYITLSAVGGANYDGSATGDLTETYTLTVTTPSVGGDATTARLAVASASGRDNQVGLVPRAFGGAFAVGGRGLKVTFTNTNTGNALTGGAPPVDFIAGQTWQVTVAQAWTAPSPTSGGSYVGTQTQKYVVTVTRGGLFQTQQALAAPTLAPTVNPTGGGASGGSLQAGTYFAKYTWVNALGETTTSPESAQFTVGAANIPQVTIPALPTGITSANVYLTPTNGASGTEVLYGTGVTTLTTNLTTAVLQESPLTNNAVGVLTAPTATPTVNPVGGGASGGALQAGTFYCKYTFTNAAGESPPSPESALFTVAAANQPQVTLPALPTGATGISLYITPANGASGGECIKYATGIVTTTYTMATAATKLPATVNSASPGVTNPAFTPTVTAAGGGASGGKLPAGTYFLKVSYVNAGGETLASTESALVTVAAGNIPQITNVPTSVTNATSFSVYLTPVGGASGSEVLYSNGNAFGSATYNLAGAFPTTNPASPGGNTTNPVLANPLTVPTATATGGGVAGGLLPPGAYFLKYTFSGKGGETQASPESSTVTVAAGNIPQVTLPSLPANATSINLYLTQPAGGSGSEVLYAQGIVTTTYNLALALPVQSPPPGPNTSATFTVANPSVAPTVNPAGGGTVGGNLPAGAYKLTYTWSGTVAGETLASAEVAFTVAAGNIPQLTVPALPGGVLGANVYLTQPGGAAGSETKFPSAALAAGPTVNLNASAASALVNPPPTVTTATAAAANPLPPQVTATSTVGGDASGPTAVTAAGVNVAVGTLSVLVQFSGNGLRKGDLYTVSVSAVAAGPYRTLVLTNNLSAALQGAGDIGVTLYLKKTSFQVPAARLSAPPALNWSATVTTLTLNAGMTAFDPKLTSGGVPVAVPVVSGPDTVLYAHYRAWLSTYAGSVTPISDPATVAAVLGTVDPDNPLAYAMAKALLNANGTTLYFSAAGDPTVLANWQNVLAVLVGLKNLYSLVPLTTNAAVLAAYQAHIDARSVDDVGGEWRVGWFPLVAVSTVPVVFGPLGAAAAGLAAADTPDGAQAQAPLANNPLVTGTNYTYLACTTRNARFVSNGVQAGDVVRYLFTQDAYGNVSWTEYLVGSVVNEDTLVLAAGPASPVASAQRFEVWRKLTPQTIANNLAAQITAAADKRVRYVWPDTINDGGRPVPGYFLCAALAGFTSGIAPHQGIRMVALAGFDSPVPRSQSFFNNAQLNTLATAGAVTVTGDEFGNVYPLHARTAAQTGVLSDQLEQMVRTDDALKYLFYYRTQQFFGKSNITPTALNMIRAEVQSGIQLAKQATFIDRIGALLVDGAITTLRQHATQLDRVVLIVKVTRNYPNDAASVSLLI